MPRPTIERFISKIEVAADGCWLWTGAIDDQGYGRLNVDGRSERAHRYSYRYFIADIPGDRVVDHLCRVRACVNPRHLEPVTQLENVQRGARGALLKTHCKRGHPLSGGNLYVPPGSAARHCRACRKARYSRSA